MQFHKITILLHPSISSRIHTLVGEVDEETTILKGLLSILSKEEDIFKTLTSGDQIRYGYLILSDKVELRTTRKINTKISTDMQIRIIPISHGG
ncbi:MAG: MoaD/ThiS family protein [Candidatus Heimdallarchaeota archaeon]|nr:MoaD/ThiS family protein [Candidatus Heimdallarchaeota archaeon]MCK4876572.1 MoaD/ThiS family protein [Candidatus Heimdallarchaeota archaeon]